MTDHAQLARELRKVLIRNMEGRRGFRRDSIDRVTVDEWDAEWDAIIAEALTQVYAAGRRAGLEEAETICLERGKPHDIDWWHNSSKFEISKQTAVDLSELIRAKAKEGA